MDNEFDLDDEQGRGSTTPDSEEPEETDVEEEEETEDKALNFVELDQADYAQLTLTEQRKYRFNLEKHRKAVKREKAKDRKQAQRDREKAGIPAGTANKLHAEWRKNREDVQSNPEREEELRELTERLQEFNVVAHQTEAAIKRMRDGVHPEALPETGRFYEIIGQNLLDLVKRYGMKTVLPIECIPVFVDTKFHAHRAAALQKMKDDPGMHYQMKFGLEIDHVSEYDFYNYFSIFFDWYLNNRTSTDPNFYEWIDADDLARNFEIPEKFLSESPGSGARCVWVRLDNFRRRIKDSRSPQGMTTAAAILSQDAAVLKTLKDLGY